MQPGSVNDAGTDEITSLQADFPAYQISSETVRDRVRYVARSKHADVKPHMVITSDPAELRASLGDAPIQSQPADGRPS